MFFHQMAKIKAVTKQISMLKVDDHVLCSAEEIERHVVSFYEKLFCTENNCNDNGLIEEVIPSLVTLEQNLMLTNLPSLDEVKEAVFSLNSDGSPGPDGFGATFFQTFWSIVAKDVHKAVVQFFQSSWLPPKLNSNLVVLIPKVQGADSIEMFRPIALANFKLKIITKVMADRLAKIAPCIVSENQRGFIQGRHIGECICLTSEAINLLEKKSFGGSLALKIDIKKAFDTMD